MNAYRAAFQATNRELHNNSEIDDSMSGTTAITVLVVGDKLLVANVSDSRAVVAVKLGNNRVSAEDLSYDQTPFRRDEYERVKLYDARVLSVDQVEGLKDPDIQTWGDEETEGNDPPRLWVQDGMYPGTAFTRSIGDSTAKKIGVVTDPEVSEVHLTPDHLFFVVASDGIFKFLTSQAVMDMVASYSDPRDGCAAIAGEKHRLWLEHESRTDDITIIIVHIKGLSYAVANVMDEKNGDEVMSASFRTGKWRCSLSVTSASEVYRPIRSEYADMDNNGYSRDSISNSRNAANVMPSPLQALHLDEG